ncbi:MAG: hypothetical protein VXV96_06990 [Bdellovibrionota bacterium]|nr:hypothetical protein [Bdellovibrionota bacterium]
MKQTLIAGLLLLSSNLFASKVSNTSCGRDLTESDFSSRKTKRLVRFVLKAKKDIEERYGANDPNFNPPYRYFSSFNCDRGGISLIGVCDATGKAKNAFLEIKFLGFGNFVDENLGDRGDILIYLDTAKDTEHVEDFITFSGNQLTIDYKENGYIDSFGFPKFKKHVYYEIEMGKDINDEEAVTKLDFIRYYPGFSEAPSHNSCIRKSI